MAKFVLPKTTSSSSKPSIQVKNTLKSFIKIQKQVLRTIEKMATIIYPWGTPSIQTPNYAATLNITISDAVTFVNPSTLTGNLLINLIIQAGVRIGSRVTFILSTDSTARIVTFGTGMTGPALTITSSSTSTIEFLYDGSSFKATSSAINASGVTPVVPFDIGSLGSTKLKIWNKDGTDPANYLDNVLPGFAQQWDDDSGNNNNLTQTTDASKPQITADGMTADASTLIRNAAVASIDTNNGELSFYIVCKISTSSANLARVIDLNGTNRFVIQYTNSGGNIRFFTYINSVQYLLTAPFDGYLVLSLHKTTARGIIRSNDGTAFTEIGMGRITGTDFSLFATNAGANSMIGSIREVVVAQGLSTVDKDNVLYELLRRYRNVTKPVVTPKGVEIRYNDTTYTYDAAYPGKNVISVTKVVADTTDGSTPAANTGLAYDMENNKLIVSGTPGSFVKVTKWNRDLTINTVTTTQITQGVAYNSETGDYYELLTTGINVKDAANNITKTLTFPGTESLPGMLFFHQHTKRFYTSYDGGVAIKVWTPDFVANTLTLHSTIPVSSEEGAAVNYIDNTIGFNQVNFKSTCDHAGNLLSVFPFGGNTGANNEGFIIDPTDGTEWFNSDEYFHGGIVDGNRMHHTDSREVYDKILRIPDQISFAMGKNNGLTINGKYGESILTGSGTWVSPVIDFGSFTLQQVLDNYKIRSGYTLSFRGSNTAPDTTSSTIFPRPYYDANQTNDGWGTTVPGSYGSSPVAFRYMQIRITL